ncbi:MAG: 4Fe-4S binding protein [Promethearchaeota archaeon]
MSKKRRISPILKEVFLQLFRKPATSKYPAIKPEVPENLRGRQVFDIDLCISCGLCSRVCPAEAIEMVDVEGKQRPKFMLYRCVFCYQCAESCPKNAIKTSVIFELANHEKSHLIVDPHPNTSGGEET